MAEVTPALDPKVRTAAAIPKEVGSVIDKGRGPQGLTTKEAALAKKLREAGVDSLAGVSSEAGKALDAHTAVSVDSPSRVISDNFRPYKIDAATGLPQETSDLKTARETAEKTQATVRKLIDSGGTSTLDDAEKAILIKQFRVGLEKTPTLKSMIPSDDIDAVIMQWLNDPDVLAEITKSYNEAFANGQIFTDGMPGAETAFKDAVAKFEAKQKEIEAKELEQRGNNEDIEGFKDGGKHDTAIKEILRGKSPDDLRRELAGAQSERNSLDEDIKDDRAAARSTGADKTGPIKKARERMLELDETIRGLQPKVTELDRLDKLRVSADGKVKTLDDDVDRLRGESNDLDNEKRIAQAEAERQGLNRKELQDRFAAKVEAIVPRSFLRVHDAKERAAEDHARSSYEKDALAAKSLVEREGLRGIAKHWYDQSKGKITKAMVTPDVKIFMDQGRVAYLRTVLDRATYQDETGKIVHLSKEAIDTQMKNPEFVERMSKTAAAELMAQAMKTRAVTDKQLEYMIYRDGDEFGQGVIDEAVTRRAATNKVAELKKSGALNGEGLRAWARNNRKKLGLAAILAVILSAGFTAAQAGKIIEGD